MSALFIFTKDEKINEVPFSCFVRIYEDGSLRWLDPDTIMNNDRCSDLITRYVNSR